MKRSVSSDYTLPMATIRNAHGPVSRRGVAAIHVCVLSASPRAVPLQCMGGEDGHCHSAQSLTERSRSGRMHKAGRRGRQAEPCFWRWVLWSSDAHVRQWPHGAMRLRLLCGLTTPPRGLRMSASAQMANRFLGGTSPRAWTCRGDQTHVRIL
jgi:hypothetical protein